MPQHYVKNLYSVRYKHTTVSPAHSRSTTRGYILVYTQIHISIYDRHGEAVVSDAVSDSYEGAPVRSSRVCSSVTPVMLAIVFRMRWEMT